MSSKHHLLLYNVLLKTVDCCGLCFNIANDGKVHIDDEVILHSSCINKKIRVINILSAVLGPEICRRLNYFNVICLKCMKSAANCYLFIKNCKEKSLLLDRGLDSVRKSLDTLKHEDMNNNNKLYICFKCHNSFDSDCSVFVVPTYREIKKDEITSNIKIESMLDVKDSEILSRHKLNIADMCDPPSDSTNLKCKVCLLNHSTFSNLIDHYIEKHLPKYENKECLQDLQTLQILENHPHKCTESILKQTNECEAKFYNKSSFDNKINKNASPKIICIKCGRAYKNKRTYETHVKLKICGIHGRRSNVNAKYICDLCNKRYTQKTTLRTHIIFEHGNHTGHICKWCGKRFNVISRLNAHMVKHTKEKNHVCDTCNSKFVTRESLLYHTRIHTGERPYKCEHCNERFLSASRRSEHVRRSHTTPKYTCDICYKEYRNNFCLKRHKKEHLNL